MIHELGDKIFNNQYDPAACADLGDYVFIYDNNDEGKESVLVKIVDNLTIDGGYKALKIPRVKDVLPKSINNSELDAALKNLVYLFSIDEMRFYMANDDFVAAYDRECACFEGWTLESLRVFRMDSPRELCMAGSTANHLHSWYSANKFCGKCGAKMDHDNKLRMMHCPSCGNMVFPRLNPAVTVALRDGDRLVVSKYANRPGSTGMALIAGFVEIGETLEECVAREVLEEVGLKAVNIQDFGSQPWGFAGNIQIGFFADVEGSTEIVLDEEELESARFISREEIPENPDGLALTQAMIEAFRKGEW